MIQMLHDFTPEEEVLDLARMVREFRIESDGIDRVEKDLEAYLYWIKNMRSKNAEFYYIFGRGYLVMEPQYDMLLKPEFAQSYFLTSVYARPEFRSEGVYGKLAHYILHKYRENLFGSAIIDSVHDKALSKRFTPVAHVYKVEIYWDKEKRACQL